MYGSSTFRAPFPTGYLRSAVYRVPVVVIRSTSARIRQFTLSLLALVAIVHANLTTDLTGRAPTASGITQLGRDIVRKSFAEGADHRPVVKKDWARIRPAMLLRLGVQHERE